MRTAADPTSATFSINLPEQTITYSNGKQMSFAIDADRKRQLLLGLDEIDATLVHLSKIEAFEAKRHTSGVPSVPTTIGTASKTA